MGVNRIIIIDIFNQAIYTSVKVIGLNMNWTCC